MALASPASAWTHGSASITPPVADAVCNFATGTFTGLGGGTCATPAATCDGNAAHDDAASFRSVITWALALQASNPGKLIQLTTPPTGTCMFITGNVNNNNTGGLKLFQIVANGTTFSDNAGLGGGFALGATGIFFDNAHSARFATITAGATSITLLNTSLCSLYTAGDWVLLAGIDPQGFGDPPNPQIYEYLQLGSVASCAGSGAIALATPAVYGYKSTWPSYNAGGTFNSDLGGPATVYALNQKWDVNQAFYGLNIDQQGAQTNSNGRIMAFYNLTAPGAFCPIPSQNVSWSITNGTIPNCAIEIDKIVVSATFTNVTIRRLIFQSGADPQHTACTNCTVSFAVSGSAGISTYTNSNIASLQIGATSYGYAGGFSATNTVISELITSGSSLAQIENRGAWASGTLTVPQNVTITGSANNGAGLIRLTVNTTAGYSTGFVVDTTSLTGIGLASLCNANGPGAPKFTVIDGTHFDIQGSDATDNNIAISIASPAVITKTAHGFTAGVSKVVFGTTGALPTGLTAGTVYFVIAAGFGANTFEVSATDGGAAINTSGTQSGQQFLQCFGNAGNLPLTWAVPGANVFFSALYSPIGPILQVADLAVGANNSTVVSFNLNGSPYAGGLPTMPGTSWSLTTHPAPSWSCLGCTGPVNVLDITGAGAAGLPYGSYASRVVTAANSGSAIAMPGFGGMTEVDFLVTAACSGVSNINLQDPFITTLNSATVSQWDPTINALIASATPRVITPTSASGSQSGDSLVTPGAGTNLVTGQISPKYSNVGNCGSASTTVTIKTNQGVVYP